MNQFLKKAPKPISQLLLGIFLLLCIYVLSIEYDPATEFLEPLPTELGFAEDIIRTIFQV